MPFLYFLADMFIKTFGITQPSPRARKRAAFFILALILLVILATVAAFFLIHSFM